MAQNYECVLLLNPTLSEEAIQGYQDQFSKLIVGINGEVLHVQRSNKRRLEYVIGKQREAVFLIFYFRAEKIGSVVQEFERQVRINDDLLREMTVKVPEFKVIELSRFEAQPFSGGGYRRSRPPMAAPAAVAEAAVAEEAPVAPAVENAAPVEAPASEESAETTGETENA